MCCEGVLFASRANRAVALSQRLTSQPPFLNSSICIDFCNISSDFVVRNSNAYDYVVDVVCWLTGYVLALPCSKTLTAQQLAE